MKATKRIRHFHDSLTPKEKSIIEGEIYECYCYEKIVNKYQDFKFIRLEENKSKKDGFYISAAGSLCYQSSLIDLGEFDIIGFDSKGNVHWYEITKQKVNLAFVEDKLKRKKELMSKLFGKYNLYLVIPEEKIQLSGLANILYIPEPDYTNLIKQEYIFNFKSNNFIDLDYLNKKIHKYDYLKELMHRSKIFFQNKNSNYNSFLFERLYDLDNMHKDSFSYYNVEKKCFGIIEIKDGKIFKDGKQVKGIKAAHKEITQIRNIKILEQKNLLKNKKPRQKPGQCKNT